MRSSELNYCRILTRIAICRFCGRPIIIKIILIKCKTMHNENNDKIITIIFIIINKGMLSGNASTQSLGANHATVSRLMVLSTLNKLLKTLLAIFKTHALTYPKVVHRG